jgi:hypothetical protein
VTRPSRRQQARGGKNDILPGIKPADRRLELVTVVIVYFQQGKIHREYIHWDQGSSDKSWRAF